MSEPKNGTRSKRRVIVWLLAVLISFGWAPTSLLAQETEEPPGELADLSLEELMATDVVSINVLGTHTHLAGEWMIGYKFMFMRMEGNRDGTDRKTAGEVLQDFPVTPTDMNMAMHMVEVMYAPSNDLTLDGHVSVPSAFDGSLNPNGCPVHHRIAGNRRHQFIGIIHRLRRH